jgi:hypothetical protein
MNKNKTFSKLNIGEEFKHNGVTYIKSDLSKARAIDGSHTITFEQSDRNILVESTGEQIIHG